MWQRNAPPVAALAQWATHLATEFARTHPEVLLFELRDGVDEKPRDVRQLVARTAARGGVSERVVRRRFGLVFGCSVTEYVTRRRVITAIQRLAASDDKVETISREVGWLSPKELYRAVHSATGYTPAIVRRLSAEDLDSCLERPQHALTNQAPGRSRS